MGKNIDNFSGSQNLWKVCVCVCVCVCVERGCVGRGHCGTSPGVKIKNLFVVLRASSECEIVTV